MALLEPGSGIFVCRCTECGVRMPTDRAEDRFGWKCMGCSATTTHRLLTPDGEPASWDPQRFDMKCDSCDYTTMLFQAPDPTWPACPSCNYGNLRYSSIVMTWD